MIGTFKSARMHSSIREFVLMLNEPNIQRAINCSEIGRCVAVFDMLPGILREGEKAVAYAMDEYSKKAVAQ